MNPLPSASLDPRVTTLWRIHGVLRLLFFYLPLLFAGGVALGILTTPLVAGVFFVPLAVVLAALTMIWPTLSYRFFRFAVREAPRPQGRGGGVGDEEDDLWIRQGVLFQTETVIPLSRIQHVDSRQGPIERVIGLSRVVIFTASGMVPDGGIPGLDADAAASLRDRLARRGGADGV